MSHVADGELHAYLDGALEFYPPRQARRIREHLERCPECRRRLDVEGRLAGEARTVLGEAAPLEQRVPPFEELRRRAELGTPAVKAAPRAAWRVRWAWAATVVLALGIGWGVGAWPGGPGAREAVRSEVGSPAASPAAAELESRAAEEVAPPPSQAPASVAQGTAEKAEAAEPTRVANAASPADPPPPAALAPSSAEASADERAASLAGRAVPERPTPGFAPPSLTGNAAPRLSELSDASVAASASPQLGAMTGAASTADASAARRRGETAAQLERPVVSQQRLTPGAPGELRFTDPRTQAGAPQRGLDRSARAAEEPAVTPPLTLPGLVVDVVEVGDVGPDPAVRVFQSRADGTTVVTIFVAVAERAEEETRPAADAASSRPRAEASAGVGAPAAPPPASPPEHVASFQVQQVGWEQVIVPFRGGWLIAQAPLSRAAIRQLLQSAGVPLP